MAKPTVYLRSVNGNDKGEVFSTQFPEYHEDCERLTAAAGKAAILEQTKAKLRKLFPAGGVCKTLLLSVSSSGMSRRLAVLACVDGNVVRVDDDVALVTGRTISKNGGVSIGGCGMDMGFALAYSLGRALYPEGFAPSKMAARPDDGKVMNVDIGRGIKHSKAVPFANDRKAVDDLVAKGWKFQGGRNGDASGWDNDGGYALAHQWL